MKAMIPRLVFVSSFLLVTPLLTAADPVPIRPLGADGKPLNLDFETAPCRTGRPRARF